MKRAVFFMLFFLAIGQVRGSVFQSKEHPRIMMNSDAIERGRARIERYSWAANAAESLFEIGDSFVVPELKYVTKARPTQVWRSLNYVPANMEDAFYVALAWALTGEDLYLDKCRRFILDVCDPERGYLSVGAATTGVDVHEGGFFMHMAWVCDILYGGDVFTRKERSCIEQVFELYLSKAKGNMHPDGIMNHQASINAGAVVVSMFLRDEESFNHFVYLDGGMVDHISKGVMPDGWWFEGTANYCYLVTNIYMLLGQIFQNNGLTLYQDRLEAREMESDFHNAKEDFTGMKFKVWGGDPTGYRTLHQMCDGFVPMMDENGVLLATNDSGVCDPPTFYELAYKEFGDPEYAWVLSKTKRDNWVALFYGVDELPAIEDPRRGSVTSINIGLTALRSQGACQSAEEQIQAYVKYGSHGGWHGHFDRVSLQALDVYGYKFFGTEMSWFGYGSAAYKEYVQSSAAHNMVVVKGLQQESVPSSQPLFYSDDTMQVSVTQSEARWRPIPTHNADKFPPWDDYPYVTEPILQRRVSVVTDHYLLMFDYLAASEVHDFDCFLHPLGLYSMEGLDPVGELRERESDDPASPYKYFTQSQWYVGGGDAVKLCFEDSGVHLDYHILLPNAPQVMVASHPVGGKQSGIKNNPNRRSIAVRQSGSEVVFVTLLEPYQGCSDISGVDVVGEDCVVVHLVDGTSQRVEVANLRGDAEDIRVVCTKL